MKFGFVITNLAGGGAERAILNLAGGLAARGHEVRVMLLDELVVHEVPANVSVHFLSRLSRSFFGKWMAALRLRRMFRSLARTRTFDLVISALPFANEVALLAGLPRLWCRIDNTLSVEIAILRKGAPRSTDRRAGAPRSTDRRAGKPRKAERRLARYRRLYGGRQLIAVSQGVAEDLRDALGIRDSRIECIYNPFNFEAIRARANEPAALPDGPYVIHVGRFVHQKRHDVLLDAWARITTPHRLVLLAQAGPGLDRMIRERGLEQRVTVAGFQANPYPWIAGAELLVLSSDHEGLPSVVIEALAVGTPVVSTDCPSGPREILGQSSPDWLVPVGDAAALAQAIRRMLADPPDTTRVNLAPYDTGTVLSAYERLAAESAFPQKDNVRAESISP